MINKWIGIGNVCADPEVKFLESGTAICNFTVACTEKYKDKSGEQQEQTEFVRVVAWQRLAEICGEYLKKGSKVYIEGKMQTREWEDKDGNKRWTTEIVAREMKMLDSRGQQPREEPEQEQSGMEPSKPNTDSDVPF